MLIICRQYRGGSGQIFVKICTKRANDLYLHPVLCRIIPPVGLNPTHLVSIEIKSILCPFSETTAFYLLLPRLLFIKTPLSQKPSLNLFNCIFCSLTICHPMNCDIIDETACEFVAQSSSWSQMMYLRCQYTIPPSTVSAAYKWWATQLSLIHISEPTRPY